MVKQHSFFVTTACLSLCAMIIASGVSAFGRMGGMSRNHDKNHGWNKKQRERHSHHGTGIRFMTDPKKDGPEHDDTVVNKKQRVAVRGVSVTPNGFVVVLGGGRSTLVLPVTRGTDTMQVKSPEALTILQLIGNIDMAGALLPPQLLQSIVALYCSVSSSSSSNSQNDHDDEVFVEDELGLSLQEEETTGKTILSKRMIMEGINEFVQETLPSTDKESSGSYAEASPWARSKVRYPRMTLDAVRLQRTTTTTGTKNTTAHTHDIVMDCTVMVQGQYQSLSIPMVGGWWKDLVYQFEPSTSAAYLTMGLALRYHAPLWMDIPITSSDDSSLVNDDSIVLPPLFQSTQQIQQESIGVKERIQTGFRVHQLQTALQMALQKGDSQAATKIRQELDSLDSMDDLPTTTTKNNNNPDEN